MKLKKLLAFGLALVMCLAMAACGANPDEKPEESTSQTDAEPVSITVTENWDFSVGFYPVITPMVSSTYGAGFWSRNFYNTLVSYDDNGKSVMAARLTPSICVMVSNFLTVLL